MEKYLSHQKSTKEQSFISSYKKPIIYLASDSRIVLAESLFFSFDL